MKVEKIQIAVVGCLIALSGAYADMVVFGTGPNQFSLDFTAIGGAGNVADVHGRGAVGYTYRMGVNEISVDQFTKAVNADARIQNAGGDSQDYWGPNGPVGNVSVAEAMKYANWLTTGDAYTGVYQFDGGGTYLGMDRAYVNGEGIAYVLPSRDEWVKAAYYNVGTATWHSYANGSNDGATVGYGAGGWRYNGDGGAIDAPWAVGSSALEQNGTHDMMGNVAELTDTASGIFYFSHGGSAAAIGPTEMGYNAYGTPELLHENAYVGFRVAAIPEPSVMGLIGLFGSGMLVVRRLFKM